MIHDVTFLSLAKMRSVTPRRDTVVISILDPEERASHRLPRLAGFRSVLSLDFEDTFEEMKLAHPGDWDDEPTTTDNKRYCQRVGHSIPSLVHAQQILDFVAGHADSDECLRLLVHCYAGVSRSGAVARWAGEFLELGGDPPWEQRAPRANPRVLRLMAVAETLRSAANRSRTASRP